MHSTIKRGSRLASGASCQPHTQVPSSNNSAAGTCKKQMQHVLKAMPSRHMSSQAAHPQAQAYYYYYYYYQLPTLGFSTRKEPTDGSWGNTASTMPADSISQYLTPRHKEG